MTSISSHHYLGESAYTPCYSQELGDKHQQLNVLDNSKKGLESNDCDRVLNDIFAKYKGDLTSNLNSINDIPEFFHNPTLSIEDNLFKSMIILTDHHFGPNMI